MKRFVGNWPRPARAELLLLLALWFGYGAALNSSNLEAFNLQQMGVEAIVERGQFYLEGSRSPRMQPGGDFFVYRGHKYAAKQPGQFMAGALVYAPLHALGLDYLHNYLLASALVTFFTTALVTALSAIALFRIARMLAGDRLGPFWPLLATLVYALATTVLPYSGIAHHDALASAYLLIALYFLLSLARSLPGARGAGRDAALAGLLLGLTLTTSMLTFFMAVVAGLYFLSLRRWKLLPHFLLGGLAGVAPLLIYNAVSFGNPLLMPNVAGNYQDTFFYLDWKNFAGKLRFYGWMLTFYAPVFWLGLVGLFLLPREHRREQALLVALVAVLAVYVLNIDADGACQYGPRYLLPAMPYASLGLVGLGFVSGKLRRALTVLALLVALVSLFVNVVGALHGAMFCQLDRYALTIYLDAMRGGRWPAYPLAAWLAAPFALSAALFVYSIAHASRERAGRASRADGTDGV